MSLKEQFELFYAGWDANRSGPTPEEQGKQEAQQELRAAYQHLKRGSRR